MQIVLFIYSKYKVGQLFRCKLNKGLNINICNVYLLKIVLENYQSEMFKFDS